MMLFLDCQLDWIEKHLEIIETYLCFKEMIRLRGYAKSTVYSIELFKHSTKYWVVLEMWMSDIV